MVDEENIKFKLEPNASNYILITRIGKLKI